jgi:hypothetical protein
MGSPLKLRFCDNAAPQWGAVFQFAGVEHFGLNVPFAPSGNRSGAHANGSADELPMLAHNIKLMEGEQNIVASPVWLELLDPRAVAFGKPSYFFDSPVLRIDEIEHGTGNREVNIFWSYMAVALRQRDGEKIKAAAGHIDDCAGLGIDNQRQGLPAMPCLDDFIAGITVWLGDKTVWASVDPVLNPAIQHLDLGYGPIDGLLSA